jgi:hypothetical protein
MSFLYGPASTTSLGLVQIGQNITVSNVGVISVTTGVTGATGATGPAGASITLNSWSPTITGSGGTLTLTVNDAHYVKTGQLITCTFDITVLSNSITGNLTLGGLPIISFAASSSSTYVGDVYLSAYFALRSSVNFLGGTVLSNSTAAALWQDSGSSSSTVSALTGSVLQPTSRLTGTIQYISAT